VKRRRKAPRPRRHQRGCPSVRSPYSWCQCGKLGTVNAQRRRWERERARRPGAHWRLLAQDAAGSLDVRQDGADGGRERLVYRKRTPVEFDEVVVDHWLHVERMDKRAWWARIGDARLWIEIKRSGKVVVSVYRGEYGPVLGATQHGTTLLAAPKKRKTSR